MNEHPDYLARLIARRVSSTRISSLMGPSTGAAQGSTSLGGASSPVSTDITKVEIRDTDPTGTALVGGRIWGSGGLLSRWGQGVRWGTSRRWGSQKSTLKWYDGTSSRQIAMTDETVPSNLVDVKGDLIVGTAADTVGRLAIGADTHVLTADSGTATGVKWAAGGGGGGGDLVLIAETVLAADAANIDFTSIPATSRHLMIVMQVRSNRATAADYIDLRFNNDSGANYDYKRGQWQADAAFSGVNGLGATFGGIGNVAADTAPANVADALTIHIPSYRQTTFQKVAMGEGSIKTGTAGSGDLYSTHSRVWWRSTAAINRVTIFPQFGTALRAGTVATLYGFK